MAPDLSLVLGGAGVLAFSVGLGALVLRVPRCPGCERRGQPEARAIAGADPTLIELVYWCRPCDRVFGRRTVVHPH